MTDNIEIVVGTYEEFIVGYKVKNSVGLSPLSFLCASFTFICFEFQDDSIELSQSFATPSHTGSVKCITAAGRYLASGGSDDKIIIHDMKLRAENKVLMHHNGTVNALAFSENGTHIFSGSTDGSLYAIRTGNWKIEKFWPKAHKGYNSYEN